MSSKDVLLRLIVGPIVIVSNTSHTTMFVHVFDFGPQFRASLLAKFRFTTEEGIMCISGRMLLGLEKSIKIPEGGIHKLICGHFLKAHGDEDIHKLFADFEQGM